MRTVSVLVGVFLLMEFAANARDTAKKSWTFEDDSTGAAPKGFSSAAGEWTVVTTDEGKVLAQSAKNASSVFNLILIKDTSAQEVDLSVRMKALRGETDQGGGLVWRAQDAKNYYLARYNPLEDNYRLYKVVNGKRTLLQNADIAHTTGWHTLRVEMNGDHIACYYDGKKYLDAVDPTFTGPGKIGLWSKADAQSQFDDLTLGEG